MSSAVSYAYRVREEELRRQRELQAARDALLAAEQRYERLRDRAVEQQQTWGDSISRLDQLASHGSLSDAAQVKGAIQQLERETTAAEKQLADQVVAARITAFREGMSAIQVEGSEPVAAASAIDRPRRTQAETAEDGDEAEVEETLSRLISRLDPGVDNQVASKVRAATELVRSTESATSREQGIGALRLLVQEANDEVREARSRELLLDRSETRLNGFDGPEAASARQLIAEVRTGGREAPSDLKAIVDAAIEKETLAQEAEYVAEELHGALEALGYQLGPDFETTLLAEGYTQFSRSSWPGYAVRVRTGGRPPHINFNVVRGESARADQAARDREVEESFCDRQAAIVEQLERAGISAKRTRVVEPGEKRLQVVEGLEEAAGTESARSASREMGR